MLHVARELRATALTLSALTLPSMGIAQERTGLQSPERVVAEKRIGEVLTKLTGETQDKCEKFGKGSGPIVGRYPIKPEIVHEKIERGDYIAVDGNIVVFPNSNSTEACLSTGAGTDSLEIRNDPLSRGLKIGVFKAAPAAARESKSFSGSYNFNAKAGQGYVIDFGKLKGVPLTAVNNGSREYLITEDIMYDPPPRTVQKANPGHVEAAEHLEACRQKECQFEGERHNPAYVFPIVGWAAKLAADERHYNARRARENAEAVLGSTPQTISVIEDEGPRCIGEKALCTLRHFMPNSDPRIAKLLKDADSANPGRASEELLIDAAQQLIENHNSELVKAISKRLIEDPQIRAAVLQVAQATGRDAMEAQVTFSRVVRTLSFGLPYEARGAVVQLLRSKWEGEQDSAKRSELAKELVLFNELVNDTSKIVDSSGVRIIPWSSMPLTLDAIEVFRAVVPKILEL